jgi:hypothetical protein
MHVITKRIVLNSTVDIFFLFNFPTIYIYIYIYIYICEHQKDCPRLHGWYFQKESRGNLDSTIGIFKKIALNSTVGIFKRSPGDCPGLHDWYFQNDCPRLHGWYFQKDCPELHGWYFQKESRGLPWSP